MLPVLVTESGGGPFGIEGWDTTENSECREREGISGFPFELFLPDSFGNISTVWYFYLIQ